MDFKKLADILKQQGLELGEEALAIVVEETFDFLTEEIANDGKIDWKDAVAPLLPTIKAFALSQVDKIDGKDDEGR